MIDFLQRLFLFGAYGDSFEVMIPYEKLKRGDVLRSNERNIIIVKKLKNCKYKVKLYAEKNY